MPGILSKVVSQKAILSINLYMPTIASNEHLHFKQLRFSQIVDMVGS